MLVCLFAFTLRGVLWASGTCGLLSDVPVRKFSVVVVSNISFAVCFSLARLLSQGCDTFLHCPTVRGQSALFGLGFLPLSGCEGFGDTSPSAGPLRPACRPLPSPRKASLVSSRRGPPPTPLSGSGCVHVSPPAAPLRLRVVCFVHQRLSRGHRSRVTSPACRRRPCRVAPVLMRQLPKVCVALLPSHPAFP